MKLKIAIFILLAPKVALSSADFQVLSGRRIIQLDAYQSHQDPQFQSQGSGSSLILSAHWSPVISIPLAFGVTTSRESIYFPGQQNSDVLYGHNIQAEIYNWLNFRAFAMYTRISRLISSHYQRIRTVRATTPEANDPDLIWSEEGNNISIGIAFGIAPSVSSLLEWQQSIGSKLRSTSNRVIQLDSQTIKIGMEIAI